MDAGEEIETIERELAAGVGDAYERHLRDDAVVIVPGAALDKTACVAATNESLGWLEFDLAEVWLLELDGGSAVLTYRFSGRREDGSYVALLSTRLLAPARRLEAGPAPADAVRLNEPRGRRAAQSPSS